MYPNSTLVMRQGEVDAWDNEEFQKAVIATGKKQIILAGITTDVCEYFSRYFKSFESANANFPQALLSSLYRSVPQDTACGPMSKLPAQVHL